MKNTITSSKLNNDNQGFSIVEVLIAVGVLAIVFTPLLKSFMTASLVNSKAQTTQNATSLAETIMEEVKYSSIADLCASAATGAEKPSFASSGSVKFYATDSSPAYVETAYKSQIEGTGKNLDAPYKIVYKNVTAVDGNRPYDAEVIIDPTEYSIEHTDPTDEDVSDANKWKLPDLSNVNDLDNAVISWEINKHDKSAADQLVYRKSKDENAADEATIKGDLKANGIKKINIDIDKSGDSILVTCSVSYSFKPGTTYYRDDNSDGEDDSGIKHVVYTGFLKQAKDDDETIGSLYVFYETYKEAVAKDNTVDNDIKECFSTEEIVITERPDAYDPKLNCGHDVYFAVQSEKFDNSDDSTDYDDEKHLSLSNRITKPDGVTITVKGTTNPVSGSPLGSDSEDDGTYYTNIQTSASSTEAINNLYATENAKNRIYKVTVTITKPNSTEVCAQLVSTMQAGKEAD